MNQKSATPKDAAAVILLNQDESKVLWAQRNPKIAFLGGWHAFPGGKTDETDTQIEVKNCADADLETFIVCAVRELFEEVGVLLVRNGEKLTNGQRASLHDDLISGRSKFGEILTHWNLWIDAEDFFYTGFWITPQFSPVRFKTRFFMAKCPPKQTPYAATSEMLAPEFTAPKDALKRWENSEVLISPPVLISLQTLKNYFPRSRDEAKENDLKISASVRFCGEKLLEKSQKCDGNIDYIELNPRLICFPLKTETLPPATHTNCFIVGKKHFAIIDAASKDEGEQKKLHNFIDELIAKGGFCTEIIVSHNHPDHIGGEIALQKYLLEKHNQKVYISAQSLTFDSLQEYAINNYEKSINDDSLFTLENSENEWFDLQFLHTPGHARGHLCFYDEELGFLLSSDNVVGAGTVVIAPPEGNMSDYLTSLERMKDLPNLRFLCGSHGSAIFDAKGKIEEYIAHRLEREKQVLEAFQNGAETPEKIAEIVYQNVKPEIFPLAVKSVEAHIEKLKSDGVI